MLSSAKTKAFTKNTKGNQDGYDYELTSDMEGNHTMTLLGDGAFSCEWSMINSCIFNMGKIIKEEKKSLEYSSISIDYSAEVDINKSSFIGVFGTTKNPNVDFYIVESWGDDLPLVLLNPLGEMSSNGIKYDIYKIVRLPFGNTAPRSLLEYWSVRQKKPNKKEGKTLNGTISLSKHFSEWEKNGLGLGDLTEIYLHVDAFQGEGSVKVTKNIIKIEE